MSDELSELSLFTKSFNKRTNSFSKLASPSVGAGDDVCVEAGDTAFSSFDVGTDAKKASKSSLLLVF